MTKLQLRVDNALEQSRIFCGNVSNKIIELYPLAAKSYAENFD